MTNYTVLQSEWIRYKNTRFFYIYLSALVIIPFLLSFITIGEVDEMLLLFVIVLTVTVLAASEIPRLVESGIIRTILLAPVKRRVFYLNQLLKYIFIYCISFVIGIVVFQLAFMEILSIGWISKRFVIYLLIVLIHTTFSQFIGSLFRHTVESLMSSLLILYAVVPIFNSLLQGNTFYQKLPFLYLEPNRMLALPPGQMVYGALLLFLSSVVMLYLGMRIMEKMEV